MEFGLGFQEKVTWGSQFGLSSSTRQGFQVMGGDPRLQVLPCPASLGRDSCFFLFFLPLVPRSLLGNQSGSLKLSSLLSLLLFPSRLGESAGRFLPACLAVEILQLLLGGGEVALTESGVAETVGAVASFCSQLDFHACFGVKQFVDKCCAVSGR